MTKVPDGTKKDDGEIKAAGPSVTDEEVGRQEGEGIEVVEQTTTPPGPAPEEGAAVEEAREEPDSDRGSPRGGISLEKKVECLTQEKEELQDRFVRLMADFDNFKKRANREKSDIIQFGNESLLRDFLPIIDTIERLRAFSYQEGNWKSFQEGIELLLSDIGKTLSRYGVEEVQALGKPFDPSFHEAMQRAETDRHPANTVVQVLQKGYTYRGRLLRPSLVVVSVAPEAGRQENGPAGGKGDTGEESRTGQEERGNGGDEGEEPPGR